MVDEVEQRRCKPIVTPESEQASEQPPGNARVPSPERVEWALEHAQNSWVADSEEQNCKDVLAAEVRRLREESADRLRRAAGVALKLVDAQDEVANLRELYAKAGADYAHEAELRDALQTHAARCEAQLAEALNERDRLRAEVDRHEASTLQFIADDQKSRRAENGELRAKLARVEALIELEHDDSTVRVSRLRAALRGEP